MFFWFAISLTSPAPSQRERNKKSIFPKAGCIQTTCSGILPTPISLTMTLIPTLTRSIKITHRGNRTQASRNKCIKLATRLFFLKNIIYKKKHDLIIFYRFRISYPNLSDSLRNWTRGRIRNGWRSWRDWKIATRNGWGSTPSSEIS